VCRRNEGSREEFGSAAVARMRRRHGSDAAGELQGLLLSSGTRRTCAVQPRFRSLQDSDSAARSMPRGGCQIPRRPRNRRGLRQVEAGSSQKHRA